MSVHDEWLKKLKNFPAENLTLPPPTLAELQLEYMEITPGQKMVAKIPFQKRFTNPAGVFQGGILSACIDEVFGPLSYLSAGGPTMTLSMNTTYLGAFKEELGHCLITAEILKTTKNFIFMRAEVTTMQGELIAHSETHVKVL